MPRVLGIDPGTVSIDICGLDDGRPFLHASLPTADALRDPAAFVARLEQAGPLDLIVGPSGYGLPCVPAARLGDADLRLAFLAAAGESGGIGGLRALVRALARAALPVVLTPGVVHLPSVPAHRKVNRVDMGTADKVCAAALAIREQASRRRCRVDETRFILLDMGGAFTAAIAVQDGRIVDGVGGSSGPPGLRAAGALDGEVAFLAGAVSKAQVFSGGMATIAGGPDADRSSDPGRLALDACVEGAVKAVASLRVSAPDATEVMLSGRGTRDARVRDDLIGRLRALPGVSSVVDLPAPGGPAGQAAHGAALVADGLAGGSHAALVAVLGVREARGTVLDHLHVITRAQAERTLGLA